MQVSAVHLRFSEGMWMSLPPAKVELGKTKNVERNMEAGAV
jgi:hypothetical protein